MPKPSQAEVDYLVQAKKLLNRKIEDNTRSKPTPAESRITFEIRKADNPGEDIGLRFHARRENRRGQRWGTSLKWRGRRIRGLNRKIREDVIRDGLIVGSIRHWHEHIWTEADEDRNIADANSIVQNEDMRSIIELCMSRWNIEGYGQQFRIEDSI